MIVMSMPVYLIYITVSISVVIESISVSSIKVRYILLINTSWGEELCKCVKTKKHQNNLHTFDDSKGLALVLKHAS